MLKVAPNEPFRKLIQPRSRSIHNPTATLNVGQCVTETGQYQHHGQRPKQPVEKANLQARYWSYLFDNLHRAVEELYTTCEADESVVECQEVVMSLQMCCKDFIALIQRIELQKQFEQGKRPPSVAWEVRKITSPSKPHTSQHARSLQAGAKHTNPSQPGAKRFLNFRTHKQSTENCSEVMVAQAPPTNVTMTTAQMGTKTTGTVPQTSSVVVARETHTQIAVAEETCHHHDEDAAATVAQDELTSAPPSQLPSIGGAKVVTSAPSHAVAPSTLSWADRVKGKLDHSKISGPPATSSGGAHNLIRASRGEASKALSPASSSVVAAKGKVAEPGDGWELACSRSRPGRRSRRLRSGNTAKPAVSEHGPLFRVSSDPGLSLVRKEELALVKSSSVAEEAVSAVEQSVSSSASLEAACLVVEPEGAGSRGTTPSPKPQELPWSGGTVNPAPSSALKGEELQRPSSPKGGHFESAEPCVMEPQLSPKQSLDWNTFVAVCEANKNPMCWADRSESPPLPDVPRSPGRAVHLHQKFSSPNRKRPIEESIRILQERQVKAQLQRGRLQEEKTHKLHLQTKKVKEVREYQDALSRQRKEEMDEKMQRAEHLRESFLQEIVKKAQAEEAKVCEIAFINSLEAQNKRIEVLQRHEDHWARLQYRQREKQKRHQEHQAREEAAQQRHRLLEIERQAKLVEKEQKRKEQDARREQRRSERDRAREEALRKKACERERKKEARNIALQMSAEELERRIQLKQDESSKRYDLQLEQIKERAGASVMSLQASLLPRHPSCDDAPGVGLYDTQKWCTLCKVKIISPVYCLSHLRGKRHQEVVSSLTPEQSDPALVITEAPMEEQGLSNLQIQISERLHGGKKRARKLKQKMAGWARDQRVFSETIQSKAKLRLQKAVGDLNKILESHGGQDGLGTGILGNLDHILSEISRILSLKISEDLICFCQLGGVASLVRLLVTFTRQDVLSRQQEKTLTLAVSILRAACGEHMDICAFFILANQFSPIVELLVQYLKIPHPKPHPYTDVNADLALPVEKQLCLLHSASLSLCPPLLSLLGTILSRLSCSAKYSHLESHVHDCISFLVSMGVVDRLSDCFAAILAPIAVPELEQLVIGGINLLIAATGYLHRRVGHVFGDPTGDTTQLLLALRQTELGNLLALLYAILLHEGPPRHSSVPPALSDHTLALAMAAFKAVNNIAIIDLKMVQAFLGAEGVSLEFRHVVSYLLWHCSHYPNPALVQELILSIGYCCVLNPDNQVFLQSGRSPTLLQLMCGLPFDYFTKPELTCLLYPTLIAACYNSLENVGILSQEISCKLLSTFLQENIQVFREDCKGQHSCVPDFYSLPYRFPRSHWEPALQFFSN